ncbi:TIGR04255 family protein [Altererythrobacter sp. GH1-8]|uniref:TIGR04255 family protein n=1 Tax=Altererythrobacter sp. GH1-8 TaxID=3349333 RepID=UPI00374CC6F9
MSVSEMHFPEAERVVYRNNPLHEVICQLRFPTILRIANETPSDFQERVRSRLPEYAEELNATTMERVPAQIVEMLRASPLTKRHRFASSASGLAVLLDAQSLTVSTTSYANWQEFSELVFESIAALEDTYRPSKYGRIGLRYQNVIYASEEMHADASGHVNWAEYIRRELVGVINEPVWAHSSSEYHSQIRCELSSEGDGLFMQYGIGHEEGSESLAFILDFDYYLQRESEPSDAKHVIERLHGYSGPAFRWAITEELHRQLGPDA